ncbi:hypothetical protein FNV43_RR06433 [Rhamnella rubrinervis]|uniref:Uncharacterized protein n=1 Tax=Rhamnella rubrinervis TaxID=2594499 RepID=A0A8K0MLS5_9ROSA|nr:hypothetical protein FNV43_RR06433 [Rhamnella rubrinervis]
MDLEATTFGRGPKELGGTVDLINQYKLCSHYEFFCKRSLPQTIPETRYLHNVVGDIDIRKGEGMELDQLFQIASHYRETKARVCPFDLDILRDAFHMRETTPVNFDFTEKGIPTATAKLKSELKDKEKRHKRLEDNNGKDHKKQKRLHMGKSSDKNKNGKANRFGIDNL